MRYCTQKQGVKDFALVHLQLVQRCHCSILGEMLRTHHVKRRAQNLFTLQMLSLTEPTIKNMNRLNKTPLIPGREKLIIFLYYSNDIALSVTLQCSIVKLHVIV
jgi:hypothetical protein